MAKSFEVTTAELADYFGLSVSRISQLLSDGLLKPITRLGRSGARYDLKASVQAYTSFLRTTSKGRSSVAGGAAERQRLTAARADMVEQQLAVKRGELIPLAVVESTVMAEYSKVKNRLLTLPGIAATLVNCDRARIELRLQTAVDEALAELHGSNFEVPEGEMSGAT